MTEILETKNILPNPRQFYNLWHGDGFELDGTTFYRRFVYYVVDGEERQMPMVARAHAGLGRFILNIYCPARMSLTLTYKIFFKQPIRSWVGSYVLADEILDIDFRAFEGEAWEDFEYDFLMAALGENRVGTI